MPRGDGTGPMGMGPMTGRGAGICAGVAPAFNRGRRFRRMFHLTGITGWACSGYPAYCGANAHEVDDKEFLGNQAMFLENQLQQVKKRLKELDGEV